MENTQTSLVIFTCEGREHLLERTFKSFKSHTNFEFDSIILAIDGKISSKIIDFINPTVIVQSYQRKGYVNNIIQTLKIIKTKYFFWLEDDWDFSDNLIIEVFKQQLEANLNWAQILHSKTGKLDETLNIYPEFDGYYRSVAGFSTNPNLSLTEPIRNAYLELDSLGSVNTTEGHEDYVTRCLYRNNFKPLIFSPNQGTIISHSGFLESTDRKWHMTSSLNTNTETTEKYLSAFGSEREIPLKSKLSIVPKLFVKTMQLLVQAPYNRQAYDMAFRSYLVLSDFHKKKDNAG